MLLKNQTGLTLVDTLLAVVILFFLTGTIIPLTFNMEQRIIVQQKQAYAAEVAFNAALKYKRYEEISGEQQINETLYTWIYSEGQICVTYELNGVIKERCI